MLLWRAIYKQNITVYFLVFVWFKQKLDVKLLQQYTEKKDGALLGRFADVFTNGRWLCCTVVECQSVAGELFLSHAWFAADGWPLLWVNHPLQVSKPFEVDNWVLVVSWNQMHATTYTVGAIWWKLRSWLYSWRKVMAAYHWVNGLVTCGLTACTLGSALGPALGNEYGRTLPFTFIDKWKSASKYHLVSMS